MRFHEINWYEVGRRIRQVRKKLGYEQWEMAQIVGCKKTSLVKFEQGERVNSTQTLVNIANVGNVSIDWLILGDKEILRKNMKPLGKPLGQPLMQPLVQSMVRY